ncbi:hypothetical protein SAMCFNEI73_pA0008 (plasmid) [Sinorhizobium americanum]|uniref:Uncharacterized protein n=1 Tax=Sinorhizobium americanum TaxID=194963 RepID=A0A1L3LSC3_9HYPH|nr:hypothetical protein SAMCFNEI73_pA0008 [Sinorhizobium americanum]
MLVRQELGIEMIEARLLFRLLDRGNFGVISTHLFPEYSDFP